MSFEPEVRELYQRVLEAWNAHRADEFAAQFTADGHIVGFDGSQADSAAEIAAHLAQVFDSHQTAAYVFRIREVRALSANAASADAALLRAVVGMVPPGGTDINPAVNAIQSLVATRTSVGWRAVILHTTPAAFHGRPDLAETLTNELRALLPPPPQGQ